MDKIYAGEYYTCIRSEVTEEDMPIFKECEEAFEFARNDPSVIGISRIRVSVRVLESFYLRREKNI